MGTIRRMALENVFSWSKSRDEQFRECQRKYYYDKYLSWGGWDASSPRLTRLAYIYKNLKNRWAWKGETVHHIIEDVLKSYRSGRPVTLEDALTRLTEQMRAHYRASKAKKYMDDPKRHPGLFEHEYAVAVPDAKWKDLHDTSADCLRNFYGSELFKELVEEDKTSWLIIEDLEEFEHDGARVYVKLDFARRKGDTVEIYDWKTGKNDAEGARVQIGAYALYAMGKWGVPLDRVRAYLFNLSTRSPRPSPQALDEGLIEETRSFMSRSIAGMRQLLEDPARNIPKPEEVFAHTEDRNYCARCNFYKICDKYNPSLRPDRAATLTGRA
ncbi:MAG: hypothetical protein MOGMAGMI_01703 [Candidatus Omnitrophica bacterium]|nr:hypothetical protein [Candidatus Omnitrophota bacterium]